MKQSFISSHFGWNFLELVHSSLPFHLIRSFIFLDVPRCQMSHIMLCFWNMFLERHLPNIEYFFIDILFAVLVKQIIISHFDGNAHAKLIAFPFHQINPRPRYQMSHVLRCVISKQHSRFHLFHPSYFQIAVSAILWAIFELFSKMYSLRWLKSFEGSLFIIFVKQIFFFLILSGIQWRCSWAYTAPCRLRRELRSPEVGEIHSHSELAFSSTRFES